MVILVLVVLRMASGPLIPVPEGAPAYPTLLPEIKLEMAIGTATAVSQERIYPARNQLFGRLVVVDEIIFQCLKINSDGSYIEFYVPKLVYMGPLEHNRAEWLALPQADRMKAVEACGDQVNGRIRSTRRL